MRVLGRTIAGVCLAVAAIGTAASAPFVPNICVQLESQLVSIERGGGNPTAAAYREYDEALNKQKAELDRARFDASRMGCQPAFSFFGQTSTRDPRCTAVQDTVDKMQANYDRLRARRDQFNFDPYSVQRDRNQVLRSLADNNCGP